MEKVLCSAVLAAAKSQKRGAGGIGKYAKKRMVRALLRRSVSLDVRALGGLA
jgi:hypothetical protein